MVNLTRKQREALKRLFDRGPLYHNSAETLVRRGFFSPVKDDLLPMKYRDFRKLVQPMFGGDKCILVPWKNMWMGIEPDGYTHS